MNVDLYRLGAVEVQAYVVLEWTSNMEIYSRLLKNGPPVKPTSRTPTNDHEHLLSMPLVHCLNATTEIMSGLLLSPKFFHAVVRQQILSVMLEH